LKRRGNGLADLINDMFRHFQALRELTGLLERVNLRPT
jgi:hypothetical protein